MKKFVCGLCLLCALLLVCGRPALAAQPPVWLDGVNLSAPTYGEAPAGAEERSGSAYVPLRFIAEMFNADVDWQNGQITIKRNETSIILHTNSRQASRNGENFALTGAPYERNGVVYVPLRFIAQAFGCAVDYQDGQIFLQTEPLQINGQTIAALEYVYERHVMGADFYTLTGHQLLRGVYNALQNLRGEEIAAPDADKIVSPSIAGAGDYIYWDSFKFKDSAGAVIWEINLLGQLHRSDDSPMYAYTYVLHDAQTDKYYACPAAEWPQASRLLDSLLLYKTFNYSTAP